MKSSNLDEISESFLRGQKETKKESGIYRGEVVAGPRTLLILISIGIL